MSFAIYEFHGHQLSCSWPEFVVWFYYPYGMWTCDDGREVLFNRAYQPIWERKGSGTAAPAQLDERVKWSKQQWIYDENASPARRRQIGLDVLKTWGLPEPKPNREDHLSRPGYR